MDPLDFTIKIAIPVLVPFIVVITAGKAFRRERTHERRKKAEAVFTKAAYAADLFKLVVGSAQHGKPGPQYWKEFQTSFESVFDTIMSEAEVGRRFYDEVRFEGGRNNMFVLLAEARIRVATAGPAGELDTVAALALYTVVYLYEKDSDRRKDTYLAIKALGDSDPNLFRNLIVAQDTPCLAV